MTGWPFFFPSVFVSSNVRIGFKFFGAVRLVHKFKLMFSIFKLYVFLHTFLFTFIFKKTENCYLNTCIISKKLKTII